MDKTTSRHISERIVNASFISQKNINDSLIEHTKAFLYEQNTFDKKVNLINDLKRFLKSNELDVLLKDIYNNQLFNIYIDVSKITNENPKSIEYLKEIEVLKNDAFDKRYKEIHLFQNSLLDKLLSTFIPKVNKGLNYQGHQNQLRKFKETLEVLEYIEPIEFVDFLIFFQEEFQPDDKKIHWKQNLNKLNHLFRIFKEKKKELHYNRTKFKDILPLMFTFKNENGLIVEVSKDQYSQNNSPVSVAKKRELQQICSALTII
ncbi:hypothetical protein [Kordia zhangzhouensis]|uniref:hypothetical protein n=1 Tax=Kordia zhangzhouensis TaxID=1620405 RepID=UPI0006298AFE|nr:hypothetical protein [Kordia zhangzhouensis]